MSGAARALVTALLLAVAGSAWAGLGGSPGRLGARGKAAPGKHAAAGTAAYSEIETKLESGALVREYLGPDGQVFAVSWSGPFLPDLKELLGAHFDTLVSHTGKGSGAGRSRVMINRSDVVIVSGGHMGAFEGRAWLPARLPDGFRPEDIQ